MHTSFLQWWGYRAIYVPLNSDSRRLKKQKNILKISAETQQQRRRESFDRWRGTRRWPRSTSHGERSRYRHSHVSRNLIRPLKASQYLLLLPRYVKVPRGLIAHSSVVQAGSTPPSRRNRFKLPELAMMPKTPIKRILYSFKKTQHRTNSVCAQNPGLYVYLSSPDPLPACVMRYSYWKREKAEHKEQKHELSTKAVWCVWFLNSNCPGNRKLVARLRVGWGKWWIFISWLKLRRTTVFIHLLKKKKTWTLDAPPNPAPKIQTESKLGHFGGRFWYGMVPVLKGELQRTEVEN